MIEGRPYPGIIHSENASTIGRVYLNVDEDSLRRLDYFEDDYYARQTVDVELSDGSHIEAFAYVVPASHSKLLSEHLWDEAKFVEVELETYLEQASRWMDNFGNAD